MKVQFEVDVRRVLMPAFCGLVGLFALHAAYPGLYAFWPKESQDLAAWVQAVGSIAAVVGVWWATTHQLRAAQSADAMRKKSLEKSLSLWSYELAERSHRIVRAIGCEYFRGTNQKVIVEFMSTKRARFHGFRDSAKLVMTKEVPDNILLALLDVHMACDLYIEILDDGKSASSANPEPMYKIYRARRLLAKARWQLRQLVKATSGCP